MTIASPEPAATLRLDYDDDPHKRAADILRDATRTPQDRARAAVAVIATIALTPRPADAPYLDLIGAWQRFEAALHWHTHYPPTAG